ncbi:methyl-accepting chemotaxis protein [Stigmatella erecta]|uniref:Methyl-accepting chemotaxis protein n=1 Tax=Stigmatella erecta TaxID=83460 RepID=A0A1I0KD02_9BACT|nr:methyl-accepting chemotaxis protein [Stigmatella erecta]SEU22145.1 Methyl-accepting chemotaxis protein [Stigmatella erecta]
MRLTFKHKMLLLPGVTAALLLILLIVSLTLWLWTRQVHARIDQGHAPALANSHVLMAELESFHRGVLDAVLRKDAGRLEPLRTLGRKISTDLNDTAQNPVAAGQYLEVLQKDFAQYQQETWRAVELALKDDAQAEAALTRETTRFESLQKALQLFQSEQEQGQERALLQARSLNSRGQAIQAVLAVLCLAWLGAGSWWVLRQVVEPLGKLSDTAARIAESGDLTLAIDAHSRDEVGQLGRSLEALVNRLRSVPVGLQAVVGELSTAAERLTKVSQEQLNFLTEQARSLSEAGSTMAEIAQTSTMASSRAEMVLKVAEQADSFTVESQKSIEQSAQGLEQIRQRVSALVGNIGQLSEQAVHAREIIGSVKDLADQSNVLALNAAIEAARAGEGGRGFAVVAREMRALSGQSLQSTERIGKILLDINQAIRTTVSSAEGDSQQMEEGIEQVLSSADKLKEITTVMQESSKAARQIVASVTQQNAGIHQMMEAMQQLSGMMGDVVLATSTAEETVGQINSTVSQLQKIVSEFRV